MLYNVVLVFLAVQSLSELTVGSHYLSILYIVSVVYICQSQVFYSPPLPQQSSAH